ncbi:MAG: prefoldin subunit beta [Candidatus Aenigmatarchaeota archaeon]
MVNLDDSNLLEQFQSYQQQYQAIIIQKEQLKMQELEINNALEEIGKSKEENVYKISGPIMIKKNREEIKKELEEKKETIELRLKSLSSAENKIVNKLKEMEGDIRKIIGN